MDLPNNFNLDIMEKDKPVFKNELSRMMFEVYESLSDEELLNKKRQEEKRKKRVEKRTKHYGIKI